MRIARVGGAGSPKQPLGGIEVRRVLVQAPEADEGAQVAAIGCEYLLETLARSDDVTAGMPRLGETDAGIHEVRP